MRPGAVYYLQTTRAVKVGIRTVHLCRVTIVGRAEWSLESRWQRPSAVMLARRFVRNRQARDLKNG